MQTKRVLLTGATGFIGRQCVAPLLARGYEVHGISSRSEIPPVEGVVWHRADLLASGAVKSVVEAVRPTHLLHLAWYAVPGKYWAAIENVRWVRASLELIELFHDAGGRRIVAAGTCAEYDWTAGHCVENRTPLAPASLYGAAKHSFHLLLESWARETGLSVGWGRIFFLYGPHEHPDRLVSSVVRALLAGSPALCTEGSQVRDFLHVADVADAFVALLDSDVTGAVNIASGRPVAVREIVLTLGSLIGRQDLLRLGARPSNEVPRLTADVGRLFDEVGWRPRYDLEAGLRATVAWWRDRLREEKA